MQIFSYTSNSDKVLLWFIVYSNKGYHFELNFIQKSLAPPLMSAVSVSGNYACSTLGITHLVSPLTRKNRHMHEMINR